MCERTCGRARRLSSWVLAAVVSVGLSVGLSWRDAAAIDLVGIAKAAKNTKSAPALTKGAPRAVPPLPKGLPLAGASPKLDPRVNPVAVGAKGNPGLQPNLRSNLPPNVPGNLKQNLPPNPQSNLKRDLPPNSQANPKQNLPPNLQSNLRSNPGSPPGGPGIKGPGGKGPGGPLAGPGSPLGGLRMTGLPRAGQLRPPPLGMSLERVRIHTQHVQSIALVRARLPLRPFPGERGFTGVPPAGESRFVSNEMVFQIGPNVSRQAVDAAARRLGLDAVATQDNALTGGTIIHFRVADGRQVADAVRALEAENIGTAQPNYVFHLQQELSARTETSLPGQYVIKKLGLGDIHRITTGSNVLVAVIDSEIDLKHPDLEGAVVERFDAVGRPSAPHSHGTGMAGAIAAHRSLKGVAPGARILAIHAFSPEARETPQATTRHILAGLEYAIAKGAKVINMSFAGPYDPMIQVALKKAHDKGIVLVAAAGNAGPKSPPLYPAADPHVIAVTATDEGDKLFAGANQGAHIAVAAPGVDVLEPAPNATYQLTTGTSVAAAHVSGVAALLLARDPTLDPASVFEILTANASKPDKKPRDDRLGWGVVDPARALREIDTRIAERRTVTQATATQAAPTSAATPTAPTPAPSQPAPRQVAPTQATRSAPAR